MILQIGINQGINDVFIFSNKIQHEHDGIIMFVAAIIGKVPIPLIYINHHIFLMQYISQAFLVSRRTRLSMCIQNKLDSPFSAVDYYVQ